MEISVIRQRLIQTIDQRRRAAVERRQRTDAATRAYDSFLERVATPIFKQFAAVLRAERLAFQVFTPGGGVRLASDRSGEDFIELLLDVSGDVPTVLGVSYTRGSRVLSQEAAMRPDREIAQLTEEDVLEFLLHGIQPLIER
jgi:hypothetical protein